MYFFFRNPILLPLNWFCISAFLVRYFYLLGHFNIRLTNSMPVTLIYTMVLQGKRQLVPAGWKKFWNSISSSNYFKCFKLLKSFRENAFLSDFYIQSNWPCTGAKEPTKPLCIAKPHLFSSRVVKNPVCLISDSHHPR